MPGIWCSCVLPHIILIVNHREHTVCHTQVSVHNVQVPNIYGLVSSTTEQSHSSAFGTWECIQIVLF